MVHGGYRARQNRKKRALDTKTLRLEILYLFLILALVAVWGIRTVPLDTGVLSLTVLMTSPANTKLNLLHVPQRFAEGGRCSWWTSTPSSIT
jgi:hypothetical protein